MSCLGLFEKQVTGAIIESAQLRIEIEPVGLANRRAHLSFYESHNVQPLEAAVQFDYQLTAAKYESLRWYFEEFLLYPQEPSPTIAKGIESDLVDIGVELCHQLFNTNDAQRILTTLLSRLDQTRIEIFEHSPGEAIPWELIRPFRELPPFSLSAREFVRSVLTTQQLQNSEPTTTVRLLLVIARPRAERDVPFRSVAVPLLKILRDQSHLEFEVEVLRPPTFESLAKRLHTSHDQNRPFDIVHFDGHGTYQDLFALITGQQPQRKRMRGYLLFESADGREHFIPGDKIAELLDVTRVRVLVLNACRSAQADPLPQPREDPTIPNAANLAFGSLADQVAARRIGVVAMRYNVYVAMATVFVADLYEALANGMTLGAATTSARRKLADNPRGSSFFTNQQLQDWPVPVVYESVPIQLVCERRNTNDGATTADRLSRIANHDMPALPSGLVGRNEAMLVTDRAFYKSSVVLLHGIAGAGKTTSAVEFAEWYSLSNGFAGPCLFTSFEGCSSSRGLLSEKIERLFGQGLDRRGERWLEADPEQRVELAMKLLSDADALWIWDNFEAVSSGEDGQWADADRAEVVAFINRARERGVRLLLTSQSLERDLIDDAIPRVYLGPMDEFESYQLLLKLTSSGGVERSDPDAWLPLVQFSQGNPLTLASLASQAMNENRSTRQDIKEFCEALDKDREHSRVDALLPDFLQASFQRSLSGLGEQDRPRIALLHLYRRFVQASALLLLGEGEYSLPEIKGLSRDERKALRNRASERGMLTNLGSGVFQIHPSLPLFLKTAYQDHYGHQGDRPVKAFVEATVSMSKSAASEFIAGNRNYMHLLLQMESNLIRARQIAIDKQWWRAVDGSMKALRILLTFTDRLDHLKHLIDELVPTLVDSASGRIRSFDREEFPHFSDACVDLATRIGVTFDARPIALQMIERSRESAAALLEKTPNELNEDESRLVHNLADAFWHYGRLQLSEEDFECTQSLIEARKYFELSGSNTGVVRCEFELSKLYANYVRPPDLQAAYHWVQRASEHTEIGDDLGCSYVSYQLASICYDMFFQRMQDDPNGGSEHEKLLREAKSALYSVLSLLPRYQTRQLADTFELLAHVAQALRDSDESAAAARETIRTAESIGDFETANEGRLLLSGALLGQHRPTEAIVFAEFVRDNGAADQIEKAEAILIHIQNLTTSSNLNEP